MGLSLIVVVSLTSASPFLALDTTFIQRLHATSVNGHPLNRHIIYKLKGIFKQCIPSVCMRDRVRERAAHQVPQSSPLST